MNIRKATEKYEDWLGTQLEIVPSDLKLKHALMRSGVFPFLRATYYRWAQLFPELCRELAHAPRVLSVADLHVENFGTWRDAEGRLVWGINDFDEACPLPYTNDLVRLAASALLAAHEAHLALDPGSMVHAILEGYAEGIAGGGGAFVLGEHHRALHAMVVHRLHEPEAFWKKLDRLPQVDGQIPAGAAMALSSLLPQPHLPLAIMHRAAGLGSLGRQRFVAVADWNGGRIAREAKALAPSASGEILYQQILDSVIRCPDPFLKVRNRWIVRRLSPDCSRIELASLPKDRDELRLMLAMGWETANVHLGTQPAALTIRHDLKRRGKNWLSQSARRMAEAILADWQEWKKK